MDLLLRALNLQYHNFKKVLKNIGNSQINKAKNIEDFEQKKVNF